MSTSVKPDTAWTDLQKSEFTPVDYMLFSLMLVLSISIGVYNAVKGRDKTTEEYMMGGRQMSPVAVAFSLFGGIISAVAILGNPTEAYFFGTQLSTCLLGFIPGCIVVHQIILPVLYNLRLVSLNEYIQLRYKSPTLRKLATFCVLLNNCFLMGLYLYAPSIGLSSVTKLPPWASVVVLGSICTIYTSIGGVKAVIYTDVLQTVIMFVGVLVVVVISCVDLGGVGNVWTIADQGSRLEFLNFDPSPFVRHTVWSTTVMGFYLALYFLGLYQPSYQRLASVRSLQISKRLCISFVVGISIFWPLNYFSGLVAYAVYRHCDPLSSGRIDKPDQILPFLVMDKLGHITGVPGIFVAAVYGGVLSSFSSCGNSAASLVWEDFIKDRLYFRSMTSTRATNTVKLITLIAGLAGICMGLLAGKLGNIFQVINSINGAIYGPLMGVFIAGICTPWVNSKGAVAGFVTAFVYNIWLLAGNLIRGGGSPTPLPLSTENCLGNLGPSANASVVAEALPTNITSSVHQSSGSTIYDVSYCYSGITGILITLVISGLSSLCTGPAPPGTVDKRLVSPSCARLHQWLWRVFRGREAVSQEDDEDINAGSL